VGDVAVGEDDEVDGLIADQAFEVVLGENGNAGGIARAGKRGRIGSAFDVGNLGGGERDHIEGRVVAVADVEVVEVAARGSQDQGARGSHDDLRFGRCAGVSLCYPGRG
jgi:hypothetical protein